MVIQVPRYHDLPESISKKFFDDTECPFPGWEISVPRRDDIAWSIVLSYLIGTNYRKKDFSERLKALTGSDENAKSVNKSIKCFNPFRNRYSCFFDKVLKDVVKDFKRNLNWNGLSSACDKLSAVSKSLDCRILVLLDNPKSGMYRTYTKSTTNRTNIITLKFSSNIIDDEDETKMTAVYNCMISGTLGFKMKTAALLFFLKEAKLPKKERNKIMSVVEKENHFLISLLKGDYCEIIRKLYQSAYIVSRISEAGYETDPRCRDSEGLSALHYAVFLGEHETLYKLYYFAASNCSQCDESYRNPDPLVVSNFHDMEKTLSADLLKLQELKEHQKYDEWKRTFDELIKLNRFLIAVNSGILRIKKKLNYYESTQENVFEANKRRDIIVTLLDTYKEYFNPMLENPLSPLDDFVLHKHYYNLIDMATGIIFFDNIIFLKDRLALENKNQFSDIESSIFFSILQHVVLERADIFKFNTNSDPFIQFNLKSFYIFPLIKRLENFHKLKEFSNSLRSIVISEENVVRCIPRSEIHSILHSYPEFKDETHISRLKHHIKAALSVKVTSVKSALVIERALQVIGEYITPEKNDFSFRRFLLLCLPKEISRILRRLRNELSHLKGHTFPSKFESEKNFSLFRSIQKEILAISCHFKVVYQVLTMRGAIYIVKLVEKEIHQLKESVHLYTCTVQHPFYLHDSFIMCVNRLPCDIFQKFKHFIVSFFRTVLQSLDNINEIFRKNFDNFKEASVQVRDAIWPLKWLLDLLQQCNDDKNNPETLLDLFKAMEVCNEENSTINDFKEKTNNFISKCFDFVTTLETFEMKGRKKLKPIKSISKIEHFLKILKGYVFLTDEEKHKIREEIPLTVRQSVLVKEKLIQSIEDGFSLEIIEESSDFEISYLSKKKIDTLKDFYFNKNPQALSLLNTPDPIEELEETFFSSCVDKKRYDSLCRNMQFSEETRKKLGKLVAGQRKKVPENNLSNLLNRIQLLKKHIIEENEEIFNLWLKVKSQKSRQLIFDRIVQLYLRDRQQQAAADMLLFDCMMLFENVNCAENPWLKSSKLYSGINLRNVISHGNPLLENLCKLLDPEDLSSEIIKKILRLIEGEDAIKAILELFELTNNDFTMVLKIVNSEVMTDQYCNLRDRILKCDDWKNYALLLPYTKVESE